MCYWARSRAIGLVLPRISSTHAVPCTRQDYVQSWGKEKADVAEAARVKQRVVAAASAAAQDARDAGHSLAGQTRQFCEHPLLVRCLPRCQC